MFQALNRWVSLKANANLWDWMRSTYSRRDLEELAREACSGTIGSNYDPMGSQTMDQFMARAESWEHFVHSLYKRYGGDIWHACQGVRRPGADKTVFEGFARLPCSDQVCSPAGFEEFMVRNAMRVAASQLLNETR